MPDKPDNKPRQAFHTEGKTDLAAFQAEAKKRFDRDGHETRIHFHSFTTDCAGRKHIMSEHGLFQPEDRA